MIVADANLIFSAIVASETTQAARELRLADGEWHAPRLWRYEVLNILATFIKAGRLTMEQAESGYRNAYRVMSVHEQDPDPRTVLALVAKHKLTAYDAQYLALADELGCTLYTQDKEVLAARPDRARRYYVKGNPK